MVQRLKLSRAQLASFLNDAESIKQFEKLFSVVDDVQAVGGGDTYADIPVASSATIEATLARITAQMEALETEYPGNSKAWTKAQGYQPQPPNTITKETTGFSDPEAIVVTYDSGARTVTLTGSFSAYWQGTVVRGLVPGWVSDPHPNTNGPWFLLYDGANFVWQNTSWTFDQLMIAFVNYGASDKFAIRETHGMMDWHAHEEFHRTIGTYLETGGDMSGYALASTTAADRRPAVSPASVHDEDIHTTVPALPDDGPYTQIYLTSTGASTFATAAADFVPVSGANPYWNEFVTPNWVQTLMANNSYMSVWLVAVPASADAGSQAYRYLWVQGQSNGSLASQQSATFGSLNLGQLATLFTEFVVIGKVIIRYQGGGWTITSVEKITGTRVSSIVSPAGTFLSTVSVTAPLTGTGTGADPIVAPAFAGSTEGLVPASAGTGALFLRDDGTWASPGGGPGVAETFGTATIDFGAYPGSNEASVAVIGQAGILAGSHVRVWVTRTTSADHTESDHAYLPEFASFVPGSIVAATGFTIYGRSIHKMQGTFTLNWAWI